MTDRYRVIAFFDGQNLFNAAKKSFGYNYLNYDPQKLAQVVCSVKGWELTQTRFYSGIHSKKENEFLHNVMSKKFAVLGTRKDVVAFKKELHYIDKETTCPHCKVTSTRKIGQEKGIDVRIALDIVHLANINAYDVALIFSQDQDLIEARNEVVTIAQKQNRFIKIVCAYPSSPTSTNTRGINGTDWFPFEKTIYDSCIDPIDYRV